MALAVALACRGIDANNAASGANETGTARWKRAAMHAKSQLETPAQRLFIDPVAYDEAIEQYRESLAEKGRPPQLFIPEWRMFCTAVLVARASYLAGQWDTCIEWSTKAAEAALDYLTGSWREEFGGPVKITFEGLTIERLPLPMDRQEWASYLQAGTSWAAIAGHWELVDKLLSYPQEQLAADVSGKAAKRFWVGLAKWWRGSRDLKWVEAKRGAKAKAEPYVYLAEAVAAIGRQDQPTLSERLERYLLHFPTQRTQAEDLPLAASLVWHLAEREGLYASLPESCQKWLVILPAGAANQPAERAGGIADAAPAATTPAARLGVRPNEYSSAIEGYENCSRDDKDIERSNRVWLVMSYATDAAKGAYLAGDWSTCGQWCRKAAAAGIDYLLGDWRNQVKTDDGKIDPAWWFEKPDGMDWVLYLDETLAWSAIGGHWDLVDKLLTFPRPEIAPDSDGKVARAYYLGLARWWQDDADVSWIAELKKLRGAGSKHYHLLADIVAAIHSGDSKALAKSFVQHVKHFLKARDSDQRFPLGASFLWNVARRRDLACEVPDDTGKYLFTLPREGK